jgi:hypothetical protein
MSCRDLCGNTKCESCFNRSFASIENSKYLHDKTINPFKLNKNINKKFDFDCYECHHIFKQFISKITNGTWCSFCKNKQLCDNINCKICFEKSFASHDNSIYWSSDNELKPCQVFKNTHKIYKFNCIKCNHVFSQKLNAISKGSWCPFCTNKQLCDDENCKICFEKSFASHEKQKFWNKNNELKPRQIFKYSSKKIDFNCNKCFHTFNITLSSVSMNNHWCHFCVNQKLCDNINCKICFEKSFASHDNSIYWSSNNKITSREVFKKTTQKYLFKCGKCNHEFDAQLSGVNNGEWCPYCAIPAKRLCNDINCSLCFDRSFASEEMSNYWSDKNKIKPREILKYCNKKYLFCCYTCNHEFDSSLANIMYGNRCPYCSVPTKCLCENEKCEHCLNKSFASHEKSKYWSIKNLVKPRFVIKNSENKYLFDCDKCYNLFESSVHNISQGRWCPMCKNKTELILLKWLSNIYSMIQIHIKFDWCIFQESDRKGEFDFIIEEKKIIVELDGDQHFRQVSNWQSVDSIQKRDFFKMKCANTNGYTVIRILQTDVFNNLNNWENNLKESLDIKYEIPTCIFIGDQSMYKPYIDYYMK